MILQRQVRKAQRRLWLTRWLRQLGWCVAAAGAAMSVLVMMDRVFALDVPFKMAAPVAAGIALIAATVWCWVGRDSTYAAATALDEAALLKERISSGLYCAGSQDEFARAVHADAERIATRITVSKHLPIRWHSSIGYAAGAVVVACLVMLLPTWDVLGKQSTRREQQSHQQRLASRKATFERRMGRLKRIAEQSPFLKDQFDELDALDQLDAMKAQKPDDLRREELKRIQRVDKAVREQRADARYGKVRELKKMLRQLQDPAQADTPASKLAKALASGDLAAAQQALKQMQEQLARLAKQGEDERVREMKKRLAELSRKLQGISPSKKLRADLRKAGLDPEQIERMLQTLTKKDLGQIASKLKAQGMSEKQIQKLLEELKKQQSAASAARRLGESLGRAAAEMSATGDMQIGEALAGMTAAAEQLSELERLEQEMMELDATLSQLAGLRQEGGELGACFGDGQPRPGPGMGRKPGQGRGGIAPEEQTSLAFEKKKSPVKTTRGAIIHQFLINGVQVKGEAQSEYVEAAVAAEHDATDALSNDRIPRQYQTAVKKYFTKIQQDAVGRRATTDGN